MSNIFTIMDDAELTQDEVLKAELFCQQFLESRFPSVDFRQGTGIRDMVIRPAAVLLASINKATNTYFSDISIKDITDSTSEELTDMILSNFFIERKAGSNSKIMARLYFAFPGNIPANVQISRSAYFSTDNDRKFYPTAAISLSPPAETKLTGITYLQFDSAEDLWYADIEMESESADSNYDLEDGDLIYFTIFNPYFIKGEILYLISTAVEKETNREMIDRSYSAISTRNLINDPSIISRLNDMFNYIKNIKTVGMGDVDMYRDRVLVDNPITPEEKVGFSIGGKVDIYCHVDPVTQVRQLVTDAYGDIYVTGSVFSLIRSAITGNSNGDPDLIDYAVPFTVTNVGTTTYTNGVPVDPVADIGLSARQVLKVSYGVDLAFKTASFIIKRFGGLEDIQTFLDNSKNRVVCADYLARSYEPVVINIVAKTHNVVPTDLSTFDTEMKNHLDSIADGGELYMSAIYGILNSCGITDAQVPITVKCTYINKGLNKVETLLTDSYILKSTSRFVYDGAVITKAVD